MMNASIEVRPKWPAVTTLWHLRDCRTQGLKTGTIVYG